MMALKLGLVGVGVIAKAQHLPVLAVSEDFDLVAIASRNATVEGVRSYATLAEMLAGSPEIEAVSLCTPPAARTPDARRALQAGKHVLLEKPPGATLSEVEELIALAARHRITLNASWHSRHAPGVAAARAWLADKTIRSVAIEWREDVRHWHPGQDWIFAAGGFGVFDPGINALSIVTHILPAPFALQRATLGFPENRQAPIVAALDLAGADGSAIHADFDFLQQGPQTWDIRVETDAGPLALQQGGARLRIGGADATPPPSHDLLRGEYGGVYAEFARLIAAGESGVDLAPLRHVADAFMLGARSAAPPFHF
ncbi:MAG: Gfo/Idh/MocA family oxidoreductase [Hyphomonadaceae bacterium]|nr:Gfo/Idh/MocA family oxidoreductase [Hyphomonadaceae bacterium]